MRFNPPPNWPAPPPGWAPPAGWQPDPVWGPLPDGWPLWVVDDATMPRTAVSSSVVPSSGPAEPRGTVLPVYFVADESYSMSRDVGALNSGLLSLLSALQSESMAAAKVRFCVVGFADTAVCYLEPVDLRRIERMPSLQARGGTSYGAAFHALNQRIPQDIARLKSDGYLVNRPAVFFLTDGEPTDQGWEQHLQALLSHQARPNILAFGIGKANASVVQQVATHPSYAFMSADGVDTGTAISEFIRALTQSVINSGTGLATGKSSLQLDKPEGFVSLAVDTV